MERNAKDPTKIWSDIKDYENSRNIERFLSFGECEVASMYNLEESCIGEKKGVSKTELKECFNLYKRLSRELTNIHKIQKPKEVD